MKEIEHLDFDKLISSGEVSYFRQGFLAFTLAEMMVVLLILSIVLAAMAPVMTTRIKRSNDIEATSIWHWAQNHIDAYFSESDQAQTAMIGQTEVGAAEPMARLIINTNANRPNHILFKNGNDVLGKLSLAGNSIIFGNTSVSPSTDNTVVGIGSFSSNTEGQGNTVLGSDALSSNTSGGWNVAIGKGALSGNTTARYNIAIGNLALQYNTAGENNIALGNRALRNNTTNSNGESGKNNIALGSYALISNSIGSDNIALGYMALYSNNSDTVNVTTPEGEEKEVEISGNRNIALGYKSLYSNTTGRNNIANGYQSLYSNTTASNNIANGYEALYSNTTGANNIANGYQSLYSNTTGVSNIANGYQALYSNTTGSSNIANGYQSLYSNTVGSNNIAMGNHALQNNTSQKHYSLLLKGDNNIAIGNNTLYSNRFGLYNIAIGNEALYSNTHEFDYKDEFVGNKANVAIGMSALRTIGKASSYNTAIGTEAGFALSSGSANTAIGYRALYSQGHGSDNTAIGYQAMYSTSSASGNVAVGENSMYSVTSGDDNVAVGVNSLYYNEEGQQNTAIGKGACLNVRGTRKTCIGYYSGPSANHDWAKAEDSVERIFIGGKSNFNGAPAVLEVHNSDKSDIIAFSQHGGAKYGYPETAVVVNGTLIVKGGIYTALPEMTGSSHVVNQRSADVSFIGSTADHNNIEKISNDGVNDFYKYYSSYGKFYGARSMANSHTEAPNYSDRRLKYVGKEFTSGLDKIRQLKVFNYTFKKDENKTPHVGIIAQDLQKIFPDAVKKGADGFLTIRMEDMFYALVNAVKELDAKVSAMASDFAKQKELLFTAQKDINTLKKENKELKAQNKKLEARLNALEAKLK